MEIWKVDGRNSMIKKLLVLLLLAIPAQAVSVETFTATNVDTDSATFVMNITDVGAGITGWFEYGVHPGTYPYKTDDVTYTTNGAQNVTISGFPLLAGKKFYYRSMLTGVTGNESNFTMSSVTVFTEYDDKFDKHYDDLIDADWNITEFGTTLPGPYEDLLGSIFWGLFFSMIFIVMWIRQEDVTNPAIAGIIISAAIFSLLPPVWLKVAYALFVVSIAGIIVSIIFKK